MTGFSVIIASCNNQKTKRVNHWASAKMDDIIYSAKPVPLVMPSLPATYFYPSF